MSMLKCSLLLAFGSVSSFAFAGAKTDGTVGPVQTLTGNFVVPQSLGTTKGGNLFHSFQNFSIESGESATFTTSTALQNVIARVTGGNASSINGLLQLSPGIGNQPHFYFINPAGVIFGAGAVVDVPAGLHVSTANYLKFADGNFYVDTARASTLSAAAPEAFGFLGNSRASVALKEGAALTTRPQQAVSIIAGDISIDNASVLALGGNIRVAATGNAKLEVGLTGELPKSDGGLRIVNGGSISSPGSGNVDGGQIRVQAGDMVIDAQDASQATGIFSNAKDGSARSGDVLIVASGQLSILNGARISTSTFTDGNAGTIKLDAGSALLDGQGSVTGVFSQANDGHGNAGNLDFSVKGKLSVLNGGLISSSTNAAGNGGSVHVTANEILLDGSQANGPDTGIVSTSNKGSGNAGSVDVSANGKISILSSAQISSASYTSGMGADVKVSASELLINGDGVSTGINSISGGSGNAGNVDVNVRGPVTISSEGGIATSAFDKGNAGAIRVVANTMTIDGQGLSAGIYSDAGDFRTSASFRGGNGGNIDVSVADKLNLIDGGRISSTTYTNGNSGGITVTAANVAINGDGSGVLAETIGVGNGGNIALKTSQALLLENSGRISSATRFIGNAGSVSVDVNSLTINGKGQATGIYSDVGTQGQGNAGNVDVNVTGKLALSEGGQISSSTISYTNGSAGTVKVNAGSINLDGKLAVTSATGNVDTDKPPVVTGILSSANAGDEVTGRSTGNAGTVNVTATDISLKNAAQISSSAYAKGKAGEVNVKAATVSVNSNAAISSEAGSASSGYAGNITITATESLSLDQGLLSIRNGAQVKLSATATAPAKTLLAVDAPIIKLRQAQITASASGNVAASDIRIQYAQRLLATGSAITTSAHDGNGGSISLRGGGPVVLDRSQITTSVNGLQTGNGGDINISAPALVLRNGFIQANTAATAASGGNVDIEVDATIASGNQLLVGGPPQLFSSVSKNLIQAAAPDGVNGVIRLSSPQVDFSASLLVLAAQPVELGDLSADLCRIGSGSSLSVAGRGGLLPNSSGLLKP
ncbi:filamentous hemagglutinin N-terminal domain-containing protein [Undibacterium sp. TJN19]|uniref:two-partner secretion domain-containing protein n=1 Tax=Undibacterium sp. TJN19 TaxID=3413055 RepID=UPI003BF60127